MRRMRLVMTVMREARDLCSRRVVAGHSEPRDASPPWRAIEARWAMALGCTELRVDLARSSADREKSPSLAGK